jgi:chromatin segregation and condensation protein Rec8/ScpA/Scc1 (kleisin family)
LAPRQASSSVVAERPVTALGLVAPPPIHIDSPRFEGSLATLFAYAKTQRVDLRDIPLMPICEAYFAYMLADEPNVDEAAAALAALSYLLERKAYLLLPVQELHEDDEEETLGLPSSTAFEYRAAIASLVLWHEERSALFFRVSGQDVSTYELPFEFEDLRSTTLAQALLRLLERSKPVETPSVSRTGRSLAEEMRRLLAWISYEWKPLVQLAPSGCSREDAVYMFLSLLELIRLGQVAARVVNGEAEFSRS